MRNMFFTASTNRFMRESCESSFRVTPAGPGPTLPYNLERAARLGNLVLCRRAEGMRVNGQLAGQLAITQHLDGIRGAADKAVRAKQFRSNRFAGWKNVQFFQIDDRIGHAERIVKTALGHAPVQRHLPALKSTAARISSPRFLPFVAGACGFAEFGADTAAHAHFFLARARRRLQICQREGTAHLGCRSRRLVLTALASPSRAA